MINRRRSGARGTPAKVNATAGLEASEGVNSASVSDGSHESVYLCPFYVPTPDSWRWPESMATRMLGGTTWEGARRLAAASYPDAWNAMVTGMVIGRGNEEALERCQRAANKAGEPMRCTVRIAPEKQR